jgi:hypothetical protein
VLFVFIVLAHERRRIVHFHITGHPTAQWTAQQIVEAFSWDTAPRYLLPDRDSMGGTVCPQRVGLWGGQRARWRRTALGHARLRHASLAAAGRRASVMYGARSARYGCLASRAPTAGRRSSPAGAACLR